MTKMTSTDYKALAERVAQRAIYADNNADPNNKAWAADLRAVVSLLNGMADAQPVAWRCEVRDLLTQAEQCLSTAVRFEQWAHDEPPSYLSAWDYEADHIAAEIRAVLAAAPAAPQAEPKRDWSTIDAAIREYLDNYELIGEGDSGADACYTPTERELYLIYDAINGLLADESFVAAISAPQAEPKREPTGAPYGIIDPDYGRVYTIARKLAWEEGYAIGLHGSFTRDLDLIAVPWAERACEAEHLIRRIADATGLKLRDGVGVKPHGRRAWTLLFPAFGDPRFVDLSVMPRIGGSDE